MIPTTCKLHIFSKSNITTHKATTIETIESVEFQQFSDGTWNNLPKNKLNIYTVTEQKL